MEIHLLGAVELTARGAAVRLGSDRERCVLASLALDVGRPIAADVLAMRLWGDDPPLKARANLHSYVSKLRRALLDAGEHSGLRPPAAIKLRGHTYTLQVADPELIDWHRWLRLSDEGRAAARGGDRGGRGGGDDGDGLRDGLRRGLRQGPGDGPGGGFGHGPGGRFGNGPGNGSGGGHARALALLDRAESLWLGEGLAGLPGAWAHSARAAMAERRLATLHTRLELLLREGRFEDAAIELSALTEQFPMDETLARHQMVALYASGRHGDALEAYQRVRRLLREQLGAVPGAQLSRAHELILRRAPLPDLVPGLPAAAPAAPVAPPAPAGPNTLPLRRHLVGRAGELDRILAADAAAGRTGSVVTIEAISGMAGVGKSALALDAAYRLSDRYPAGQIYLELHSHSVAQAPKTTEAALHSLLRAFGIPPQSIPPDLQERISLWRTVLKGKRALIVLDDASSTEQVVPLLPNDDSASLVLITSRHRLTELPAARPMFVDVLPVDDAISLFRRLVGAERAVDPGKIAEIVDRCGLLPLAIEIVASRFKARPAWDLDHVIERLRRPGRLTEIRYRFKEVAGAFEMSYSALTAAQRSAFRRLSLHPGPDFGPYAAAALIGEPLEQAELLIEDLLDCHLLQEPQPNRYRFHDLIGEYAALLADLEEPASARAAAVLRLGEYALHAADRAERLLRPHRDRTRLPAPAAHLALPAWPDQAAARAWLAVELECLLATESRTRADGNARQAAHLAHTLAEAADAEGYWDEAVRMHEAAATHWRTAPDGDPGAEPRALLDLATIHAHASRYPAAAEAAERALALSRAAADEAAEAEALNQLGVLHWSVSEYDTALTILQDSLRLRSADRWGHARSLNNLAITYLHMGDHANGLATFTESLRIMRELGDPGLEAKLLNNIGDLRLRAGEVESAQAAFREALTLSKASGTETDRAVMHMNFATTLDAREEFDTAVETLSSALAVFRRFGDLNHETICLNALGTVYLGAGRSAEAKIHYESALRMARELGISGQEAEATRGLGTAEGALDQLALARRHLETAAALALRIGSPEEEALACEALAGLVLRDGDAEGARELLQRALALWVPFNDKAAGRVRQTLTGIDHPESGSWQKEA